MSDAVRVFKSQSKGCGRVVWLHQIVPLLTQLNAPAPQSSTGGSFSAGWASSRQRFQQVGGVESPGSALPSGVLFLGQTPPRPGGRALQHEFAAIHTNSHSAQHLKENQDQWLATDDRLGISCCVEWDWSLKQ